MRAFRIARALLLCSALSLLSTAPDRMPVVHAETSSEARGSQPAAHHAVPAKRLSAYGTQALVQDLRVSQDKQSYRLVLDLSKKVRVVQRRDAQSGRLILDLTHTNLSKGAAEKFVAATVLPQAVQIALSQQQDALRLSLNAGAVSHYRHYFLTRPHRFVLDFTPVGSGTDSAAGPVAPQTSASASPRTGDAPTRTATAAPPSSPSADESAANDAVPVAPRRAKDEVRTIVLDPGHGGKDSGTISRRGLEEKAITLKVALRLRDLIKSRLGTRVLMTREQDEFIELGDRAKFANSNSADLFVSIHVNSHPQSVVKGIEVYHFGEAKDQRALAVAARENGTPITGNSAGWEFMVADLLTSKRIEDSLELAWETKEAMLKRLSPHYPTDDHGVKTAPFYVLRYTAMPSILAEIAFMSNPSEEQLMRQSAYINDVAEALFLGVKNYVLPASNGTAAAR